MGLLDAMFGAGAEDPRSVGMEGLIAGLLSRNAAGGLLAGSQGIRQARKQQADDARKQQLFDMQLESMRSEIDQRKAAERKNAETMALAEKLLGGGAQYQPQLGSGTMDVMPNANPLAPGVGGGLAGASPEAIAALKLRGVDLMEPWKVAKQGFEQKAGTYRVDPRTGQREYIENPEKGIRYQGGRITAIPGYNDFTTAQTLATEAPKALLNAAGQLNLRNLPDGRQIPVSALDENPTLRALLGGTMGQQQPFAPTRPQVQPQAPQAPQAPAVAPQPGMRGAFTGEPEAVSAAIEQIKDPQERANARAAFEQQMRANNGQLAYGKTTAQQTAEEAAKAGATTTAQETAKDIAESRKSIMNAGFAAPTTIAKYQQIGKLLQDVDGGKLTPAGTQIASAMNSIGIKIDKNLPNKEAAAALGNEMALQLRSPAGGAGMPGALSDKDREFLVGMIPNAAQSAQGRKMLIDAQIALAQRQQQVATFARNYEKKYGRLDNGFFEQMQQWSNANPLFGGK